MAKKKPSAPPLHDKDPSTKVWFIVHILIPLLPVLSAIILRFIFGENIELKTFKLSDMALSIGIIVAFARQSLIEADRVLDNEDKREEVIATAMLLLIQMFFCFISFASLEILDAMTHTTEDAQRLYKTTMKANDFTVIVLLISIYYVIRVQRGFKLKAKW